MWDDYVGQRLVAVEPSDDPDARPGSFVFVFENGRRLHVMAVENTDGCRLALKQQRA